MTHVFHNIDDLCGIDFDEYSVTSLSSAVEQLTSKLDKIKHLDDQLFRLYTDASELEIAVMDAEELYDDVMDKIACTQKVHRITNYSYNTLEITVTLTSNSDTEYWKPTKLK